LVFQYLLLLFTEVFDVSLVLLLQGSHLEQLFLVVSLLILTQIDGVLEELDAVLCPVNLTHLALGEEGAHEKLAVAGLADEALAGLVFAGWEGDLVGVNALLAATLLAVAEAAVGAEFDFLAAGHSAGVAGFELVGGEVAVGGGDGCGQEENGVVFGEEDFLSIWNHKGAYRP